MKLLRRDRQSALGCATRLSRRGRRARHCGIRRGAARALHAVRARSARRPIPRRELHAPKRKLGRIGGDHPEARLACSARVGGRHLEVFDHETRGDPVGTQGNARSTELRFARRRVAPARAIETAVHSVSVERREIERCRFGVPAAVVTRVDVLVLRSTFAHCFRERLYGLSCVPSPLVSSPFGETKMPNSSLTRHASSLGLFVVSHALPSPPAPPVAPVPPPPVTPPAPPPSPPTPPVPPALPVGTQSSPQLHEVDPSAISVAQ